MLFVVWLVGYRMEKNEEFKIHREPRHDHYVYDNKIIMTIS